MYNDRGQVQNDRTLKIDEDKRKFNNMTINTTERFMDRPSML
jgi:hypothetical protein